MLAAAAIGFAPAIVLMLITLQNYTYPRQENPYFSDPTFFALFTLGIFIGIILYVVSIMFGIYYLILGFLLEESIKLLILNLKRFQRKADTPFYGFGLGAGIAAALAFGGIYRSLTNTGFTVGIVILIVYSIQLTLLNTSAGTMIGMGVARGTPWPFFGQVVVVHLAFILLMTPFELAVSYGNNPITYVLFGFAAIFVAVYYWYVHYRLLPLYVKEAIAKMKLKKARKAKV